LIHARDTKIENYDSKISLSFTNGYYHIEPGLHSKRKKNLSINESNSDLNSLIEDLTNQVYEIVKGINPCGRIRIPKDYVIPYFKDKREVEEGLFNNVYAVVSRKTGMEIDVIKQLLWARVEIV
jgi:hypothetical protein